MNPDLQAIMAKYKYNPASTVNPSAGQSSSTQSSDLATEFSQYVQSPQKTQERPSLLSRVGEATGIKGFGEAIGTAIAAPKEAKRLEESQQQLMDAQTRLLDRRKQRKAEGADTSKLDSALQDITKTIQAQGAVAVSQLTNDITDEDIIGDALKLSGTIAGFARLPGVLTAGSKATGILSGAGRGALEGAASGALSGVIGGAGESVKSQQDLSAAGGGALGGGITGGIGGGVFGGVLGAVTGGLKGRALRKSVLDAQVSSGEKPPIDFKKNTITTIDQNTGEAVTKPINDVQKRAIETAKAQGFDDTDTAFVLSLKPKDRAKASRMIEIAEKSLTDKRSRALSRPEDVLGESVVEKVRNIETINSNAGKRVDDAAKALRGQIVDASAVRSNALEQLTEAGVTVAEYGSFDFSKSIFKKTPELANKIKKALSDLPDGGMDAEQLHLFKKSMDQIVEYGKTSGKAFTAKAESILKGARATADDVLDSTFPDYNAANTDFKNTKELLEELESLFGKKVGVTEARGGQLMRGIFSNNQSRSRLLQILPRLEELATQYGVNTGDNLIDQAIFVDLMEEVYGTQAATSLQGQVGRGVRDAVGTTQKVIAGLRNPVQGAGELAATVAEKLTNVSPEQKRAVLRSLLGDLSEKAPKGSYPSSTKMKPLGGFIGPNKKLAPESEDVILKGMRDLYNKGFKAKADGSMVNLDSFEELRTLVELSDKGPLTQEQLRAGAELLKRQGVKLPILRAG